VSVAKLKGIKMSDDLFDTPEFKNTYHMISREGCGYCEKAINLFNILGVPVNIEKLVTEEEKQIFKRNGHRTFPRIFKNGALIGGYDDFVDTVADQVGNR
jgi:glutaredoxin